MRHHLVLLLTTFLLGCGSSTSIVRSWRDPEVTLQQGSVKRILIIALVRDEATRRQIEDELSVRFTGRATSSYYYLGPLPDKIEKESFLARLRKDGFDAMMVMRLVDVTKEETYMGGNYPSYYYDPWGYYGYAYPMYVDPGYVYTDQNYRVETNFYSVEREKLMWSGTTSTMNPTDIAQGINEIATAIQQRMVSEGFLTAPAAP